MNWIGLDWISQYKRQIQSSGKAPLHATINLKFQSQSAHHNTTQHNSTQPNTAKYMRRRERQDRAEQQTEQHDVVEQLEDGVARLVNHCCDCDAQLVSQHLQALPSTDCIALDWIGTNWIELRWIGLEERVGMMMWMELE